MAVWPYMPEQGYVETLEWKTDVIRTKGTEQRFALRALPRQVYRFTYVLDPDIYSRAKSKSRALGAATIQLPVWGDLVEVGDVSSGAASFIFDTTKKHYAAGAEILLWESNTSYEVLVVDTLNPTGVTLVSAVVGDYTRALVVPLTEATFAQALSAQRHPAEYVTASASFLSQKTTDLSPLWPGGYPSYRGHEVLTDRSVMFRSIQEVNEIEVSTVDNGIGVIWLGEERNYPITKTMVAWDTLTKEELWNLRTWLYGKRGRWRGFWLPSWSPDIQLTQSIGATDTSLTIAGIDYPSYEGTRDLMILTTAGVAYYLRVTDGSYGLGGEETLNLEAAAGVTLALSEIAMVSYLTFVRFDSDRAEIRHYPAGRAVLSMPVIEAPVP